MYSWEDITYTRVHCSLKFSVNFDLCRVEFGLCEADQNSVATLYLVVHRIRAKIMLVCAHKKLCPRA